jgi:hypothetical protein
LPAESPSRCSVEFPLDVTTLIRFAPPIAQWDLCLHRFDVLEALGLDRPMVVVGESMHLHGL